MNCSHENGDHFLDKWLCGKCYDLVPLNQQDEFTVTYSDCGTTLSQFVTWVAEGIDLLTGVGVFDLMLLVAKDVVKDCGCDFGDSDFNWCEEGALDLARKEVEN